jgi:hypothetical protein
MTSEINSKVDGGCLLGRKGIRALWEVALKRARCGSVKCLGGMQDQSNSEG